MKPHRPILALLGMGAVLATGFWLIEQRRAQTQIAAVRAAQAAFDEAQRRLAAAEEDLRQVVRERIALERAIPGAVAEEPSPTVEAPRSSMEVLRATYLGAYRASLAGRWGLLFQILGLEPAQIAKLEELLVQREENGLLVRRTARARGMDESAPEIQALDDRLDSANKAAIKALLGSAGYNQFRQYYHDRAILPVVSDLAGATYATEHPLSADQAKQLIRALADSSAKSDSGSAVEDSVDWGPAMVRAQAFLAPDQLAVLTALQQQYRTGGQLKDFIHNLPDSTPPLLPTGRN